VADEGAAEEEAAKAKQGGSEAYAQADVVVALGGWDENSARPAAEGALRALKVLLEADKELPSSCLNPCKLSFSSQMQSKNLSCCIRRMTH